MSEFDARDSVDHLPEYERWVEQQNEEQFAQREKEEHDAQKRAAQDVKRANGSARRKPMLRGSCASCKTRPGRVTLIPPTCRRMGWRKSVHVC